MIWPGHVRRKARGQVRATCEWWRLSRKNDLYACYVRAKGYYSARDWLGVESAYIDARTLVDKLTGA